MKEFVLIAECTISIYTVVKADSLEEAIQISEERGIVESDYQGENKNESWVSDEYDGEPKNIELSE